MNTGNYEDYLIREAQSDGEDFFCSQCERFFSDCVCEELCDAIREQTSGGDPGVHTLPEPTSFTEWLNQTGDSI